MRDRTRERTQARITQAAKDTEAAKREAARLTEQRKSAGGAR